MNMDQLNRFMSAEVLPSEMRRRLREYFMHTKHLRATRRDHELLEIMSDALRGMHAVELQLATCGGCAPFLVLTSPPSEPTYVAAEVTFKVNEKWLSKVSFLRGASRAFLVQLSLHLHPHVYAPKELCPLGFLYIIHRGLALFEGRLLGSGKVWGEDVILTSAHLRSRHHGRALTFLDVLTISAPRRPTSHQNRTASGVAWRSAVLPSECYLLNDCCALTSM